LKVVVVSFATDEAWDALLGVKTTEAGTTAAAVPSASSFIRLASPTTFLFLIRNQIL
jgi:hypothetical protein